MVRTLSAGMVLCWDGPLVWSDWYGPQKARGEAVARRKGRVEVGRRRRLRRLGARGRHSRLRLSHGNGDGRAAEALDGHDGGRRGAWRARHAALNAARDRCGEFVRDGLHVRNGLRSVSQPLRL